MNERDWGSKSHSVGLEIGSKVLAQINSMKEWRQGFITEITDEVAKMIAKTDNSSVKEAKNKFTHSRTYGFLAFSNDPFVEEGPEDFFEMYQNDLKYGRMITNTQLYLERHPKLYKNPKN